MKSLADLIDTCGDEKTLIITCREYGAEQWAEINDQIFIYFLPDNMLHKHDYHKKDKIQHFIESKQCTKLIYLTTLEKHLIESFEQDDVYRDLRSMLNFNLSAFLMDQSSVILLTSPIRYKLLTEQHVIAQCNMIMEFYFIRDRVNNGQLNVIGVITDRIDQLKRIFHNGIAFDNTISMN